MNCHEYLRELRAKSADPELRSDVDSYAARIATALKTVYRVDV